MIDDDGFLFRTLFDLPIMKTLFTVAVGMLIWKTAHWFCRLRVLGELVYRTRRPFYEILWESCVLFFVTAAAIGITWRVVAADWNASIMGDSCPRGTTDVILSVLLMVWGFAALLLCGLFGSLVQLQFRRRGLFDKGWGFIRWSRVHRAVWRDKCLLVLRTAGTCHRFVIPEKEVEAVDAVLRSCVPQVDEEPSAGWRRGFVEVWCNRRTVLTLGLILVVLLANFVYQLGEYRREAAAAEQLQEAGAIVDWEANYGVCVPFDG